MNSPIILYYQDEEYLTFDFKKSLENIWYNLWGIRNLIEEPMEEVLKRIQNLVLIDIRLIVKNVVPE